MLKDHAGKSKVAGRAVGFLALVLGEGCRGDFEEDLAVEFGS